MAPWLKNKSLWAGGIGTGLIGLYALLGFVVAPDLLRTQAQAQVAKTYGRELQLGGIRLNPFLLRLEVSDLALPDRDGRPLLSVKQVVVDFELASAWRRAWVFSEFTVQAPWLRVVRREDGGLNLADLVPAPAEPPPAQATELPRLWIELLALQGGRLDYEDQVQRSGTGAPLVRSLSPLAFSLKDFRTTAEGGGFSLTARSQDNEQFSGQGRFALAPVPSSEGEFSVAGLRLAGVAELAADALPLQVSAGTLDLAGSYRFSLADTLTLALRLPRVAVSDLALRARGDTADTVQLPRLEVTDTVLSLPERRVDITGVALTGLSVNAWTEADGTVSLQRLFRPPAMSVPAGAAARQAAPPQAPAQAPEEAPAAPWAVALKQFDLTAAAVDFEDRRHPQAPRFAIKPLNLSVSDLSLDLSKPVAVALDATLNGQALLKLGGSLTPAPFAAALDVSLAQFGLALLQPYIAPHAALTVQGGMLSVAGQLRAAPAGGKGPQLSLAGDVTVEQFKSIDNATSQDLLNFRRLQVKQLRLNQAPDALDIASIQLDQPFARVAISKDRVLNVAAVFAPPGPASAPVAGAASAPAPAPAPAPTKSSAAAPRETLPIRIGEVRVAGGRLNFADQNVQPNFAAEIFDLQGAVKGLSSAPTSRANVQLAGKVDEFSPVTINGSLQPFAFDRFTDIALQFNNISLPLFNPYSGRFTGYVIAKGKLDTTLRYRLNSRQLDAQHQIRINQLEWGEASATQGAATLPVRLATALLRDKDGLIALGIPVAGTLDDPSFSVWPIVWQVLGNLIVKVVTAPFSFIASLFDGAQDAQFVDFAPGRADIDAATATRLATLARVLVDKPGLSLDVPIGGVDALDRAALAEQGFERQRAAGVAQLLRRKPDDKVPLPAFDSLPVAQRLQVLRGLLATAAVAAPAASAASAPAASAGPAPSTDEAQLQDLQRRVRDQTVVAPEALAQLGQERARAVQRALLDGTALAPERVFISASGKVGPQAGQVRFELGMK